jgi:hypothetical protein
MHKVIGYIEEKVSLPIIHIADATADQIQKSKISIVGLIGTKYTMEQDFYKSRIESKGIKVLIPISEELCLGEIQESSRHYYKKVIKILVDAGAEGIILGCTEIRLLLKQEDSDVPVFDTTVIHAIESVNKSLERYVGGSSFDIASGERSVFEQYKRAINAARSSIYIENQALPIPEIGVRLEEALNKLMLIDDVWETIGSYNLHSNSLFGHTEMNATFWDPKVVRSLRSQLLIEHLGQDTIHLNDREALSNKGSCQQNKNYRSS